MNIIFYGLVAVAFLFAFVNGTPAEVGDAALKSAKTSVELAIGLVGYIALFLGLMEVVKEGGGLDAMAKLIRPLMVRLFPDVPPDHPAMGAMIMNIAANALGLGNAATPFGLKAMQELDSLNTEKGTATNAMVLFLAINTSGLALLPTGIIGLRDQLGSIDAAVIFPTTLMATSISTVSGVLAAKLLCRLPIFGDSPPPSTENAAAIAAAEPETLRSLLPLGIFGLGMFGLVYAVYIGGPAASAWIMPGLVFGMLTFGVVRKVKVYEVFVRGAKEGFNLALLIIPYLVAILSAMGMLRASGGLERITGLLSVVTAPFGLPGEVLPLALLRPLSGSGAFGVTADLLETYGPDSYIGNLASTMSGSTETTFYVLAVYFGSVGVSKIRHAVPAGLAADFMGVVGSVLAVRLLLGGG